MNSDIEKILLVGAGKMAREYAKILKALKRPFIVVGRNNPSALEFEKEIGLPVNRDRLTKQMLKKIGKVSEAFVVTNIEELGKVTRLLLENNVRDILVEKPGGLDAQDIRKTALLVRKKKANVYLGYNRRFYASTEKAAEIIKKDGGVSSFTFDFTERADVVEKLPLLLKVKQEWFLANSSHVADLAFFLCGKPRIVNARISGKLPWHSKAAVFVGSGQTSKGALFSYHANWSSSGRWSIEIMTPKRKLILRPLEKLQVQEQGTFDVTEINIADELDKKFKPGLYKEVRAFLDKNTKSLATFDEQVKSLNLYETISKGIKTPRL